MIRYFSTVIHFYLALNYIKISIQVSLLFSIFFKFLIVWDLRYSLWLTSPLLQWVHDVHKIQSYRNLVFSEPTPQTNFFNLFTCKILLYLDLCYNYNCNVGRPRTFIDVFNVSSSSTNKELIRHGGWVPNSNICEFFNI